MMKFKAVFKSNPDFSVPLSELKIGQIGVLTKSREGFTLGLLVQWSHGRESDALLRTVGGDASYWGYLSPSSDKETLDQYRVRILRDGDKLVFGRDGAPTVEWAKREPPTIPLRELRPGQIGEIAKDMCGYEGTLVACVYRRAKDHSVQFLDGTDAFLGVDGFNIPVRVLQPGDRIEVTE